MELTNATRRVFVSVSSRSPHFTAAWEDPQAVVQAAIDLLKEKNLFPDAPPETAPSPRLLVVERWSRIHLVFDIFHPAYNPENAHLPEHNDLPTLAIFFCKEGNTSLRNATATESKLRKEVNRQVQEQHTYSGIGGQPPFIADHANGNVPVYMNPRT